MAFVNPASAVIVGAVDSHHLLGLYPAAERFSEGFGIGSRFRVDLPLWFPILGTRDPGRVWKRPGSPPEWPPRIRDGGELGENSLAQG